MKTVRVRLFAAFREFTGTDSLELRTSAGNAKELYGELCATLEGLVHEPEALVAVNDRMCHWDTTIQDGDEVLLFPPVAGG